ncbi:hypothetical protein PPACK8108_LOCUS5867 [Phakopsora pachyrhizi]|uniref:Uncharacterized protein n=1 Tax=Phakopsora pachyrhizi TaxID=170000 RepID=A0AAV0ARQ4_PHAPC|nr:hypothetical protein PPACK8108_LOCUS5867 [Phakopsora pachyrhizi]
MPRKNQPSKALASAGSLKEKSQSASHSSPMATTSNPVPVLASGQDCSEGLALDHDHNRSSQVRHNDSASASELDDQDLVEHEEAHDKDHALLNDNDDNEDVDEHKTAALQASEALFGFHHASHITCGID